jgi:antitoxin HigA-1
MIRSFKHKGLAELFERGRSRRVRQDLQGRCWRRLEALDHAESLTDLHIPGFNFHGLQGVPTRYSIHVNGPWCITFEWEEGDALRVDLEQYHWGEVMEEYLVQRPLRRPPIHPGEVVREDVLPALGLSVSEAARRLGVSRQQLHRILACTHPITTEMALRIGRLAGNGPGLWLRMQQAHDLWHTEQRLKEELAQIAPVAPVGSDA